MKKRIKSIMAQIKRNLSVKIPTPYPVLHGNLLEGRTAFITGGSSGIGLAIAKSFLQNGANIVICGKNHEKLQTALNELKSVHSHDQSIDCLVIDISNTKLINDKIDAFIKNYPHKIDILVNNAGTSKGSSFGKTSINDFENLAKVNLEGTYFIAQYFYNYMKQHHITGNILNIASASSLRPANSPYIVSKWGTLGLTKGLAKVAIQDGIIVNSIAPGPTATAMLNKANANDINLPQNPSGRLAMPEEIANLSTVLVSDLGKLIVGDTLFATGGAGTITYDDMEY